MALGRRRPLTPGDPGQCLRRHPSPATGRRAGGVRQPPPRQAGPHVARTDGVHRFGEPAGRSPRRRRHEDRRPAHRRARPRGPRHHRRRRGHRPRRDGRAGTAMGHLRHHPVRSDPGLPGVRARVYADITCRAGRTPPCSITPCPCKDRRRGTAPPPVRGHRRHHDRLVQRCAWDAACRTGVTHRVRCVSHPPRPTPAVQGTDHLGTNRSRSPRAPVRDTPPASLPISTSAPPAGSGARPG